MKMKSWHLHIEGQVQGVGFRPFVYELAQQQQLAGWVNNTVDGVHIAFNADTEQAERFTAAILHDAPELARITGHQLTVTEPQSFTDFRIIHSRTGGAAKLLLTPDFALCSNCRSELQDPENRRWAYPFITCTHCGPRYSITRRLPYDRETTAMATFSMCPQCRAEYDNHRDRRYYSQTSSCPDCRITLSLIDRENTLLSEDATKIVSAIPQLWEAGKIIAIKGIGGYLLTCDARNDYAIRELRTRKHRPTKPFALMYPSVETIRRDVYLSKTAEVELQRYRAPIVLLKQKTTAGSTIAGSAIAPGLQKVGIMLPYTPLFDQLLREFGHPIVATSGNISNAPIVFEEAQAQRELLEMADYLLSNNRDIVVPQDDSVIQFTPFTGQKIVLRRSRGMAPSYIDQNQLPAKRTILATGAMLKSTFTFFNQGNTFISQYVGDLQHFDTEQSYRHTLQHFFDLFAARPELVLTDKHPEYASTRYGLELAEQLQLPVEQFQHHIAHFGAILGEHQLLHNATPVLGVIWDGTGLGDDGQIWGGEFFLYQDYQFSRCGQFEYFDFILGDKMAGEPRLAALAIAWEVAGAESILRPKFSNIEWPIYRKLLDNGSSLQSSSVGRIFDAVASLLGLADRQSYEGEAALQLESLALAYCEDHGLAFAEHYLPPEHIGLLFPTKKLIEGIISDLQQGTAIAYIAAKFHYSLVLAVELAAQKTGTREIAFSGGVFQNSLLVDLLIHRLNSDFQLYFHRELSPNDENISYGQLISHHIRRQESTQIHRSAKLVKK